MDWKEDLKNQQREEAKRLINKKLVDYWFSGNLWIVELVFDGVLENGTKRILANNFEEVIEIVDDHYSIDPSSEYNKMVLKYMKKDKDWFEDVGFFNGDRFTAIKLSFLNSIQQEQKQ